MIGIFIEQCVVDGSALLEAYNADEHGVHSYFQCTGPAGHVYRAVYDGIRWSPIDQGDYDDGVTYN